MLKFPLEDEEYILKSLTDTELCDIEFSDDQMNRFFKEDASDNESELISKIYFLVQQQDNIPLVGFSLSNSQISAHNDIDITIPYAQQHKSYPAVRIGKFATNKKYLRKGFGRIAMSLIKLWFLMPNKTGCRYIVVDSRRTEEAEGFYYDNGFEDYPKDDLSKDTKLMYFDLLAYKRSLERYDLQGINSTPKIIIS